MPHQMDSKNCSHRRFSFRGFGRNPFRQNDMKAGCLLQPLEKFIPSFGMRLVTFILVQKVKFSLLQKITTNNNIILQDSLSAVDAAKQFYKIIWSENNFNRIHDKSVTTAEEHNIDLPELPHYLRFQRENGS